jgi:dihydrofolate reductase
MIRSIIAAVAENNVIGKDNRMVWHLPADLKYFKNKTKGHYVIMGRKTFESLDGQLPGRPTIIVTRQTDYHPEGCYVVHDVRNAFSLAEEKGENEVFILGGAEIYKLMLKLDLVDKMYLTEIKAVFEGDSFFPEFDKAQWKEVDRQSHAPDEKNKYPYAFVEYVRRQ